MVVLQDHAPLVVDDMHKGLEGGAGRLGGLPGVTHLDRRAGRRRLRPNEHGKNGRPAMVRFALLPREIRLAANQKKQACHADSETIDD